MLDTSKLNKSERLAIIRFCLNKGTRVKYSTHGLLRPLEMRYLEDAFKEYDNGKAKQIEEIRQAIQDYKNGGSLGKFTQWFFENKKPSIKKVEQYFNRYIKEEEETDIRRSYHVAVDYEYTTKNQLDFHNSMNPKITFGYSNVLHEECEGEITEAVRNRLLSCFKDRRGIEEFLTFGGFEYGEITEEQSPIYYEDLIIWQNERQLLSTITHEEEFYLSFNDEDINAFHSFENSVERNEKIIKKLRAD